MESGKRLHDSWSTVPANGLYDFVVTGPGSFYRRFSGDAAVAGPSHVAPEVRAEHGFEGEGCLHLMFVNDGATSVKLTLAANAYTRSPARHYQLEPGATVEDRWSVQDTYGWYDLSVTCDASATFLRRLAGRVESGRPSVSDPATA